MLDNTITLSVDAANTGSSSAYSLVRLHEYDDKTIYYGPSHTRASRELMTFTRSEAKPSGSFRGIDSSTMKITVDVVVPGSDGVDRVAPFTIICEARMPVGVDANIVKKYRQVLLAALDNEALMTRVHGILEV